MDELEKKLNELKSNKSKENKKGNFKGLVIISSIVFLLFLLISYLLSSNNPVGFYGLCGFEHYPITINKDGTMSIFHGNIYGYNNGRWEKVDGGIKVYGLSGDDRELNGVWEYGRNNGFIAPDGYGYCKSPYSND